jgi:Mitochondrial inner membrane protein
MVAQDKTVPPVRRQTLPPSRQRGSGLLTLVFVGLALLGGVAAWPSVQPILSQLHLGKLIGALDGPVGGPVGGTVNAPAVGQGSPPEQASYQSPSRTDRLEAGLSSLSMRQDMVELRLAKAEAMLRTLPDGGAIGGDGQKIEQELNLLRQQLDALEHASANVRHLSEKKDRLPLFLLGLGQLREAVDRGTPYEAQLRTLASQVVATHSANTALDPGMVKRLETLQTYAADGVDTRVSLALRYNDVLPQALRAAGIAESSPMMGRVMRWMGAAINVRRAEGVSDVLSGAVSSVIIRAGKLLVAGDLDGAVKLLQPVAGQGGDALDLWLKAASGRVSVDAALSELAAQALAQTASGE